MYSREELIRLCQKSIIAQVDWKSPDTPTAIAQIGRAWAYLKAGCNFKVHERIEARDPNFLFFSVAHHNHHTIKKNNAKLDYLPLEEEIFFLPQPKRLKDKTIKDWNNAL